MNIYIDKRRPFLELLILSAQQGANLSDENIRSQVDTFMFEVSPLVFGNDWASDNILACFA